MSPLEVNLLAATIVLAVIVVVLVIAIAATQAGKRFVRELTANMLHRGCPKTRSKTWSLRTKSWQTTKSA